MIGLILARRHEGVDVIARLLFSALAVASDSPWRNARTSSVSGTVAVGTRRLARMWATQLPTDV
jgi:hypothetical protein